MVISLLGRINSRVSSSIMVNKGGCLSILLIITIKGEIDVWFRGNGKVDFSYGRSCGNRCGWL